MEAGVIKYKQTLFKHLEGETQQIHSNQTIFNGQQLNEKNIQYTQCI